LPRNPSGQTVRTGALRGPIRPACSALTSANGIPLCPNPSNTRKVAGSKPSGTTTNPYRVRGLTWRSIAICRPRTRSGVRCPSAAHRAYFSAATGAKPTVCERIPFASGLAAGLLELLPDSDKDIDISWGPIALGAAVIVASLVLKRGAKNGGSAAMTTGVRGYSDWTRSAKGG
jgi:hypothetical protein